MLEYYEQSFNDCHRRDYSWTPIHYINPRFRSKSLKLQIPIPQTCPVWCSSFHSIEYAQLIAPVTASPPPLTQSFFSRKQIFQLFFYFTWRRGDFYFVNFFSRGVYVYVRKFVGSGEKLHTMVKYFSNADRFTQMF